MKRFSSDFLHMSFRTLSRRPVLTAMMVYLVGVGIAATIGTFAVWRESSRCPLTNSPERRYVVQTIDFDRAAFNGQPEQPVFAT